MKLSSNAIFLPIPPDVPLPFVATQDIAGVAVRWLLNSEWIDQRSPAVYGPQSITLREATEILSEVLAIPIRYVEISGEQMKHTLRRYGAGEGFAAAYVRMCEAFGQGSYNQEPRTEQATTATHLREWAMQNLLPAVGTC